MYSIVHGFYEWIRARGQIELSELFYWEQVMYLKRGERNNAERD